MSRISSPSQPPPLSPHESLGHEMSTPPSESTEFMGHVVPFDPLRIFPKFEPEPPLSPTYIPPPPPTPPPGLLTGHLRNSLIGLEPPAVRLLKDASAAGHLQYNLSLAGDLAVQTNSPQLILTLQTPMTGRRF
ncbi:hypothetical protein V502_02037 [Pseudogymnoascus sp. VKM F-4520 (FW-2644)]|nr:hypothetical protein V502_02037 [Pseudogymnoascus sp. VKM F-4520 (FW-2644)]